MQTQIVQKAIITNTRNEVLLLKRSSTAPVRALEWDLPGGLTNTGEMLEAAMLREVKEETGLDIDLQTLFFSGTYIRNDINYVYLFWTSQLDTGEVVLSYEHVESKWVPLEAASNFFDHPLEKHVLEYLINNRLSPAAALSV